MEKENLMQIIESSLLECHILKEYQINTSRSVHGKYEFFLDSKKNDRWLYFRIEASNDHYKVLIWLNQLMIAKVSNFDVEMFCKDNNMKTILNKFKFKAAGLDELKIKIMDLFESFEDKSAEKIKRVLNGSLWIDSPFDWHGYK